MDVYDEIDSTSGPGTLRTTLGRITTATTTTVVLDVSGEIDLLTEDAVRQALARAFTGASTRTRDPASTDGGDTGALLVIDLSAVTFLSSTGMGMLVEVWRTAADTGVALRLVSGERRSVLRPLQVAGLDAALPLFGTRAQALAGHDPSTGAPPAR